MFNNTISYYFIAGYFVSKDKILRGEDALSSRYGIGDFSYNFSVLSHKNYGWRVTTRNGYKCEAMRTNFWSKAKSRT